MCSLFLLQGSKTGGKIEIRGEEEEEEEEGSLALVKVLEEGLEEALEEALEDLVTLVTLEEGTYKQHIHV